MDWNKILSEEFPPTFGKKNSCDITDYWHHSSKTDFSLKDGIPPFATTPEEENMKVEGKEYCQIFEYERFHRDNNFSSSKKIIAEDCVKTCDFILIHNNSWTLIELTTTAETDNNGLNKKDKRTNLSKLEKIPLQLAHTAKALSYCNSYTPPEDKQARAVAGIRYNYNSQSATPNEGTRRAFNRNLTQKEGQQLELHNELLNNLGYTFWRIVYPKSLTF